jgi:hypothetical protein
VALLREFVKGIGIYTFDYFAANPWGGVGGATDKGRFPEKLPRGLLVHIGDFVK